MEDFESSALPEWSWLSSWGEKAREQWEKQRDAYKKAQVQLQKSQKDEKKAKGDNEDLFAILLRFIQNPYYEELIPIITELLQISTPSRFIIALIALIYPEAALYVLTKIDKKDTINLLLSMHHYEITENFNENTLHPSIRVWMSAWVQFSQGYLVAENASHILHWKLLGLIQDEHSQKIHESMSRCIRFFFASRNIHISQKVTDSYTIFILMEYMKILEKTIATIDPDLLKPVSVEASALFGIG